MREIILKPELVKFETFRDFAAEYQLNQNDLILTTKYLYDTFVKECVGEIPYILQDSFGSGEPTGEMVQAIFDAAEYDSYDRVVAIGGGTVLDIGKLLTIRRTGSVNDLFFHRAELIREKKLIAIPTTSGTGSEVTSTSVAIVKDEEGNTTKMGLLSEDLIADVACLIPEFLYELPMRPFAEAMIDALIHATESYLSPTRATMTTELFSLGAIRILLHGLKLYQQGVDIRKAYASELLTASCYAGIAFLSAGCGIVHGVSYPMSGAYFVTHGAANYVFFPETLRLYAEVAPEGKIKEIQKLISEEFGCETNEALETLRLAEQDLLPIKKMHEYGVKEEDIESFTASVLTNQQRLVKNAYIEMTKERIIDLYRAVW